MKDNVIQIKSYDFAKQIIELYRFLKDKKEFELGSQVLRSGTSIGANIEEAIGGESRKDFIHKIAISYKEARECHFWLRLLRDTKYIDETRADSYLRDCEELLRILGSIQRTTKNSVSKNQNSYFVIVNS